MSKTNTQTANGRKILATAQHMYLESLPRSLRHITPGDALNDSKDIIFFLRDALEAIFCSENELSHDAYRGASHVFDLLLDKIEIGDGSYKFPFMT